jgi:hypothetical protein
MPFLGHFSAHSLSYPRESQILSLQFVFMGGGKDSSRKHRSRKQCAVASRLLVENLHAILTSTTDLLVFVIFAGIRHIVFSDEFYG